MSLLQPARAPAAPARRIVGCVNVIDPKLPDVHAPFDILSCRHLIASSGATKVRRCGACSELFFGEADKNDSPTGRARGAAR